MLLDLAIAWDPNHRRCDFRYDGGIALDTTPLTPVLLSLGSDRRAEPDDTLPDGTTDASIAAGINPRRGWAGDAFDADGNRAGSLLWLLDREKQTDDVLRRAQEYAQQSLAWLADREGVDIAVAASWPTRTAMLMDVQVASARVQVQLPR